MNKQPTYKIVESIRKRETVHTLTDSAMVVRVDGRDDLRIEYKDVHRVWLSYRPRRFRQFNYECQILFRSFKFNINSSGYKGVGNFEDQRATYTPFIQEFVRRLKLANPGAKVYKGSPPMRFWVSLLIVLFTILILMDVLYYFPFLGGFTYALHFLMFFYFFYYSIRVFRNNYPHEIRDPEMVRKALPVAGSIK